MLSIPQVLLTFKESSPILSPACELPDGAASASFPGYLYLPTKTHRLATAKLPAAAPHLPRLFMSLLAAWNALPSLFVHLVLPHSSKLSRMAHSGWNLSPTLFSLGSHLAHTSNGELKLTTWPSGTRSCILQSGVSDFITPPYTHSASVWEMTLITETTQLTFVKHLSCARIQDILGRFILTTYGG